MHRWRSDWFKQLFILALILGGAAALRLWNIDRESLWADEALTVVISNWPVSEMLTRPTDETPLLYYSLHKLFISAQAGAAGTRGISAVAGILSILAMYFLGRLALGPKSGLLCAALLAVWFPHVDYSQEARAYSLLFLLTTVSAMSLLWWFWETRDAATAHRVRMSPARLALGLFAASTVASFYAHVLSVFWIAPALQILVSVTSRTRSRKRVLEMTFCAAVMAVLALPGIVRLFRKLKTPDAFHWLPQATPAEFAATVVEVMFPVALWPQSGTQTSFGLIKIAVASLLLGSLFIFALAAGFRLRSRLRRHLPAILVILTFLSLPMIIWLFGYAVRPVFMPRTVLFAVPGMILLIAGVVRLIPSGIFRATVSLASVGLFLAPTLASGAVREKEDWRAANHFLAGHVRPGDLIIACPIWKYPALRHATAEPVSAPVLASRGNTLLVVEERLGSDDAWAAKFFDNVTSETRLLFPDGKGRPRSIGHLQIPAGSSIWLVLSECDSDPVALLRSLSVGGAEKLSKAWKDTGPEARDDIEILRYRLSRKLRVEPYLTGGATRLTY